ncbi:glycine--tRNA ligase subunit beta [Aestuariispira insulae]|uniref:Glycine--tRNA ligase beta subunit n=1 Tax=Aestuariispira insulae TaxID=1461337 RepID=A0A3D9HRW4_9PROT|nr:glycine--tRNA ligase subunit beta [Aestuariispira insulae]RED52238.1 glycyl-tRNA synthetase beta chain [Aestuariispira insulae]
MTELLIELFSEEIPAGMQTRAADDFKGLVETGLKAENLTFDAVRAYSTPRRLTLVVEGLPLAQPDVRDERKGPKVGAPEQAVAGFLRGAGLESLDQCEQRETPKGAVWFAVIERKGRATTEVLPGIILDAINKLPWAKSMRFADQAFRWVRPLRRVNVVFNGAVLDGSLDMGGRVMAFGNETEGHRFLSHGTVTFTSFDDYEKGLLEKQVVLDPAKRREMIASALDMAVRAEGLTVKDDPKLLDEVTGLVEYPVVLIGNIDPEFMEVPREVLTSSMRANQKYFTLENPDGSMATKFALVSNMVAKDGGAAIANGNERVLRARLADAKFFWDQDRKKRLEDNLPKLDKVIFHAKLGSVAERVARMEELAETLCDHIEGANKAEARRAAQLSKADLVSEMVYEFPEVQGIMGRYYAIHQGENEAVANAIADHYSPAGPNDACPTAPVSVAVALAEKLDTLSGFWAMDEKPTGSKDPYALRRAALGIIRLILENGVRVNLAPVLRRQIGLYSEMYKMGLGPEGEHAAADDLLAFFADRLKVHLKSDGVAHDHIQAVFALGGEDDLVRLLARVKALGAFLGSDDGANLLTAYRRAANILKAEEKKDGRSFDGEADAALCQQDEETALVKALEGVEVYKDLLAKEDFEAAMSALATLRAPVDAFFDQVTVNADDPALRENRLKLLSRIRDIMGSVADFGQIEG